MNSVQNKTDIRSTTLFGLSVLHVMFEDDVDDFVARQQVYNLLNDADLPDGVTPEVQPLYGPTGEIFRYTLRSEKRGVRELKTLQDWVIERNLLGRLRCGRHRELRWRGENIRSKRQSPSTEKLWDYVFGAVSGDSQ